MLCPHCQKEIPDTMFDTDLYNQAVKHVMNGNKATISFIQRCTGIGYNKAASFIERMESDGIVSMPDTNGKRTITNQPTTKE